MKTGMSKVSLLAEMQVKGLDPGCGGHHRCIVCGRFSARFFTCVNGHLYRRCGACHATFLNPAHRLSIEAEHARYRLHRNDPADKDYRRFFSKLVDPLLQRLSPQAEGLDCGCGPGPALAWMLREA
jgi:hypothetical protein